MNDNEHPVDTSQRAGGACTQGELFWRVCSRGRLVNPNANGPVAASNEVKELPADGRRSTPTST